MTGGWIQVNNELIRIPAGTIVVMPNTFLTWEELFEFNPNTHQTDAVIQTGLAMADTVRFPGTYEVDHRRQHRQRTAHRWHRSHCAGRAASDGGFH